MSKTKSGVKGLRQGYSIQDVKIGAVFSSLVLGIFGFLSVALSACSVGPKENNSQVKIIGGEKAASEYPFFVSLTEGDADSKFCGASYIGNRVVLTAAHCAVDPSASLSVHFSSGEQMANVLVERMIVHENYDSARLLNDVALLLLSEDAPDFAVPVALSSQEKDTPQGSELKVIGFGNLTTIGWIAPDSLFEVNVPVLADDACSVPYPSFEGTKQVCAGSPTGGLDSCQGDSGGPLFSEILEDGSFQLEGIVSYGTGCAQPNFPGVYTRVSGYLDWIHQNIELLQKPILVGDTETLTRLAVQKCVSAFKSSTSLGRGQSVLTEERLLSLNSDFYDLKRNHFRGKVEKEPACVTALDDGTEVRFFIAQSRSDRKNESYQLVAQVGNERGYRAAASLKFQSNYTMQCKVGEGELSWGFESDYAYSYVSFLDANYSTNLEAVPDTVTNQKSIASCWVAGALFELEQGNIASDEGESETVFIFTVKNLEGRDSGVNFRHLFTKRADFTAPPLSLKLEKQSGQQNPPETSDGSRVGALPVPLFDLVVSNDSPDDLYGWQIVCDSKVELKLPDGSFLQPTLNDSGDYIYESFGANRPESTLLRGQSTRFGIAHEVSEGLSSTVYCAINGYGSTLEFL